MTIRFMDIRTSISGNRVLNSDEGVKEYDTC